LQAGLTATCFAAGFAVGAPTAGRFVGRQGRKVLVVALTVSALGIGVALLTVRAAAGHLASDEVAFVLAPALFVAGLGGGGVVTPNQALTLHEVDVAGGSTAGGTLQTAQRVGSAIGAAMLSAVFYGQLGGELTGTSGAARAAHFGHAYSIALAVALAMSLAALALAVRETRVEARQ
jgi:MFS family permease